MARLQFVVVAVAVCVLGACGSSKTDSGTEAKPSDTKSESSETPAAEFSVATWNQEWSAAKQKYVFALQGFNNQMNLLDRSGATDDQYAMVITTNSRKIADAARALVKALDAASPIPADRADLQQAVDNLRTALLNEEKAYRTSANCRRDLDCLKAARPAVIAAAKQSGAALQGMPSE